MRSPCGSKLLITRRMMPSLPELSVPCRISSRASRRLAQSMRCWWLSQGRSSAMACWARHLSRPKYRAGSCPKGAAGSHRQASSRVSGRRAMAVASALAALELIGQLRRQIANHQGVAAFVIFDLRTQQVRLETDREAFGTAGKALELAEGAFVRRDLRRQAVVLVADMVVEGLGPLFVDQPREFGQGHGLAQLGLAAGITDQGLGLLSGLFFWQVFAFDEVAEGLEQGAGLARAVDAFLAADKVAEVFRDLLAVLALDKGDVLLGVGIVLPLGNIDPRRQMQLAQVQVLGRGHVQRFVHRHAFAVVQQGDNQVVGHALLVMGEQHMAPGGQVGLLHQLLQLLYRLTAECGEILAAV